MSLLDSSTGGFLEALRLLGVLERDQGSEIGLPTLPADAHPMLLAARAALGEADLGLDEKQLLRADGIGRPDDIPLEFLRSPLVASDDARRLTEYVVTEMVRNVDEHSCAKQGAFVRVAVLGRPDRLAVGIADRGIGCRRSLVRFHYAPDDRTAVRSALTPGISGSTARLGGNSVNAGAGLYFTRGMAVLSGMGFLLVSGNAAWHLSAGDSQPLKLHNGDPITLTDVEWQGTVVGVDLPLAPRATRDEIFAELNRAYRLYVKEARKDFYSRRSLTGEDFRNRG